MLHRTSKPGGQLIKQSNPALFMIPKDDNLLKPVDPVPAIRNPGKSLRPCRHGYRIFNPGHRHRQTVDLPLRDHQPVKPVITLRHPKQDRLTVRLTPFLVFILLPVKICLPVLHKLHPPGLIQERENQYVRMFRLYRDLVFLYDLLRYSSPSQVSDRLRLRLDRLRRRLHLPKLPPWTVILIHLTPKREIKILGKRQHVPGDSTG